MNIKDIMVKNVFTISENTTVKEIAQIMTDKNIGAIPVTDYKTNKLMGIITDRDIITRCLGKKLSPDTTTATEIMTKNIVTVCPQNSVTESTRIMAKNLLDKLTTHAYLLHHNLKSL